jgi:membrane-bound lytic murein transglycosylase B
MPRGLRAQIPAEERVEEVDIMEEDAPAPQQGGRRRSVVISQTEYDFLHGGNQCLERMEQRFANIEQKFTTQGELLKAILDGLPPAGGESSSVPHKEQQ